MAAKPVPPRPAPRLYLATPGVDDLSPLMASLPGLLAGVDVAAVLVRLKPTDPRTMIARVKALAPAIQDHGAALLLDGHVELVARAGADGVHLTGIEALAEALPTLLPDRIAGVGGLATRHDSMAAGEAFIQYVYEAIRNSPVWPQSLLIVTYDEHGAFFDHQNPPAAIAPNDGTQNHSRAENPQNFAFDRLGVRVPAVAISPWIAPGGLGSQAFPGKVFDHTSIIKTVMNLFGIDARLNAREQAANSIEAICSLSAMRTDGDAIASMLRQPAAAASRAVSAAPIAEMPDHATNAFSRIAMSLDLSMKAATPLPPVAITHPSFAMDTTQGQLMPRAITGGRTKQQTLDYIQAVAARVERLRPPNAAAGAK